MSGVFVDNSGQLDASDDGHGVRTRIEGIAGAGRAQRELQDRANFGRRLQPETVPRTAVPIR